MSKDYSYRSTWEHAYSRAINKARRNNTTKEEMMKKYGRFPRKNEWFGPKTEKEWIADYLLKHPKPSV
jgi:uncharacterized protein (DUF924 family)